MLTLYHNPYSRSSQVRWALEELGVPYELAEINSRKDYVTHGFDKVHPLMLMPTLVDDGSPIFETAAICLYLADKYAGLAPPVSDLGRRGLHYQWCVFAVTELDRHIDELHRHVSVEAAGRDEAQIQRAAAKLFKRAQMLSDHLAVREFMLGDAFGMADILVSHCLGQLSGFGLLNELPVLLAYVEKTQSRPAALRARPPR